ncbi:hypothetical protein QUG28_12755 [Bacillus hominis]|uniref:hypothetical protein n=1 Tax=Bacillus hominis TaxID=2817478 RepID=UPI0025A0D3BD|nr:hypothetical protein [Bacillus hominis]MDM5433602.1 hypothetical protein [Bacillus hominis]
MFSVRSTGDPLTPVDLTYVVRVTVPVDPYRPGDPVFPTDPHSPVIINTWGINFSGVIQQGNTVLHGQFQPQEPIFPGDPA